MKNPLFLSLAVLVFLAACKKEKTTQATLSSKVNLTKSTRVIQPAYTVMNLALRNPGENFDTYFASWNDCMIKVTGPLSWDFIKYPNLVDGVPIVASNLTTYDGTSYVGVANSGIDGNVFEVTQVYLGGVPSVGFKADYDGYIEAWVSYFGNGSVGLEPQLSVMLKTSYSAGGASKTYTGKLIRVTTGSGLAIAPVNYPLPVKHAAPPTMPDLGDAIVADPQNVHSTYFLIGTKGDITSACPGLDSVFDCSKKATVYGSYTNTPGTGIFHYWGTVVRPDGTFFSFDVTQDTN